MIITKFAQPFMVHLGYMEVCIVFGRLHMLTTEYYLIFMYPVDYTART